MGGSRAERKADLVPLRVGEDVVRRLEESDAVPYTYEGSEITVLSRYQLSVRSSINQVTPSSEGHS
jgi:hypothetical protein